MLQDFETIVSAIGHVKNIHRRYLLGGMVDFEKKWGRSPDHSRFLLEAPLHLTLKTKLCWWENYPSFLHKMELHMTYEFTL